MARWNRYNNAELAWVKANSRKPRRALHEAFVKKFDRPDISQAALKALCLRNGWLTGRDGRLKPGNVPANKGKKMPYNANSARTQFKKGQSPRNAKPLGHERVNVYGYVEVLVDQVNPYTGYKWRYVQKHIWLWEKENGPVPKGQCLKCLDGNKQNTDPANWEAIPRAVLAQLNNKWSPKFDEAEPEVKPALLNTARLRHRIKIIKDR